MIITILSWLALIAGFVIAYRAILSAQTHIDGVNECRTYISNGKRYYK
jgi:hypothetical protein